MQKTQKEKISEKTTDFDFEIKVQSVYVEQESNPENNQYFFAYKIFIHNRGKRPAQLLSRHWIISDSQGNIEEIRGAGVVGAQPHIQPGKSFEYDSGCPLRTPSGSMRGSYQMISDNGQPFEIEIPEFYLIAPFALH